VRDPNGAQIACGDDVGPNDSNAYYEAIELPVDGVYSLDVHGANYLTCGAYTLIIERVEGATVTTPTPEVAS
jgi:hypothetical protein